MYSQLRIRTSFTVLVVLGALFSPISAPAASALVRPSTVWGYTLAGPASTASLTGAPRDVNLDAKSKFSVDYKGFPDWAKNQVQAAVDVWAANFSSKVTINVDASWGRSTSSAILGSARPGNYYSAFTGAPDQTLWYPSALANALAGKDLDKSSAEIVIQINSTAPWDLDTEGAPSTLEYDLMSVMIHELAHGLGFLSTDSYDDFFATGALDEPTIFDAFVTTSDGRRLADIPSPSVELGTALTSKLEWSGPLGIAANSGTKPLMYSPEQYDVGSSVSHLDESTFSKAGKDSVMTPSLDAGEVFHEPGPLLLAMMSDLRNAPPPGIAAGLPSIVRNPTAVIGDGSAIFTFDPPTNARGAAISNYVIRNIRTGAEVSTKSSPVAITGLKNGVQYAFSITAKNELGNSEPALTNGVTPRKAWSSTVLDAAADGKSIATTTLNGKPVIAYTDSKSGFLKLAVLSGTTWKKSTIDGHTSTGGRTGNVIKGNISLCVSGSGTRQTLHMFYADGVEKDLRYATYDGKKFTYSIVDGNGPSIQSYEIAARVRTASDVSVSNACAITPAGIEVFYRDESQGVLLGATKVGTSPWKYELIDGDRKTDSRTTGDVAFHLKTYISRNRTYILYDSVGALNSKKEVTSGEIRLATRTSLDPLDWEYKTLDETGPGIAVAGYDVAIAKINGSLTASWMTSTVLSIPSATQLRWAKISSPTQIASTPTQLFGNPSEILNTSTTDLAFNCLYRLCSIEYATGKIALASSWQSTSPISSVWVRVNSVQYLVAGIKGKLVLVKKQTA